MNSHASLDLSSHRSPFQNRLKWVPIIIGIVAFVCGLVGWRQYDGADGPWWAIWSNALYHTLQLFVLHASHLDDPVPPVLHAARLLAAFTDISVVGYGLITFFWSESLLTLARLSSGHVVICGLGRLGFRLAQEFRRNGTRVLGIDVSDLPERIAAANDAGIAVVVGDASSPTDLQRVAVGRAEHVIAVSDDEQTNVAIAAAVGKLLANPKSRPTWLSPLECWIFIADAQLRQTFRREFIFPYTGPNFHVNVRGLDLFELATRQILARSPLDFERIQPTDATSVRLVIVGFGPVGQQLALQAAKIGVFANFRKTNVTVVEREDSGRPQSFLDRYPKFTEICDFTRVPLKLERSPINEIDSVSQLGALAAPQGNARELLTFAFCWDTSSGPAISEGEMFQRLQRDDPTNLHLALALAEKVKSSLVRFLVFQTRETGFGALFPADGRGKAIGPRMHAFGMLEELCSLETLLQEREDAIAKVLHQNYYDNQIEEGRRPGSKPALFPWEQLAEQFKDSNRQGADHIPVKLRALGYRVDRLGSDHTPVPSLEDSDEVELLAKMEHERWRAEWWLKGYTYAEGKRDDRARTHPLLVSWDELDQETREWDRQLVRAIPDALERAGSGIYQQIP
jgi:hypothetical protein